MRLSTALLALAALPALAGCTTYYDDYGYGDGYGDDYGYGGVSIGVGFGTGYGHGYGYGCCGYGFGFGHYSPWYDPYWAFYGGYPYWGWYNNFYYPGSGIYVYDHHRRRHHWDDDHRRHWTERRDHWNRRGTAEGGELRENWRDFAGDGRRGGRWRRDGMRAGRAVQNATPGIADNGTTGGGDGMLRRDLPGFTDNGTMTGRGDTVVRGDRPALTDSGTMTGRADGTFRGGARGLSGSGAMRGRGDGIVRGGRQSVSGSPRGGAARGERSGSGGARMSRGTIMDRPSSFSGGRGMSMRGSSIRSGGRMQRP